MKKLLFICLLLPNLLSAQIVINEIAPNNSKYFDDEDFEFPDWIELMNVGGYNINISQYGITDNPAEWNKWLLPDMVLNAGDRLIIYASAKNRDCYGCPGVINYLHTNFKLSNGETVALYNSLGTLIDSATIFPLQAGHTMARIPDGGSWCYTDEPTPDNSNAVTCYSGYSSTPVIATAPGFYTGSVNVTILGTDIHYTLDGDWPNGASPSYTSPISISTTQVLNAVQVEAGKLPSKSTVGTFFIDETTLLPVVSISSNSCDMFDEGPSCAAAYDGATGWEPDNPQVPATVEYFTADHVQQFNKRIKFETAGNSSIYVYPQRGMQFTCDEDFGESNEFQFNIFENYKPGLDSINGFRVRANNDWGNSAARMKDVIANRLALPTTLVTPSYQNVATFINGEYWGHYSAREELDKYFLRNNQGVNPDMVDIIRSGAGEDVWDIAEAGTMAAYNSLIAFFNSHNMTNAADYAEALTLIDRQNWVDHFATQFFLNNDEMAYNIRCFKSYEPDMKWKFILWDTGAGSECYSCNSIGPLINYPYYSEEINMMHDLMNNEDFSNYFVNRYADLMNYYFTWEITENLINENVAEIEAEIPAHKDRWGSPTIASFNSGVAELKTFYENRVFYQRNEIESYFDLNDQINVTLQVNPEGAGLIKISTIVPENLPWTGVYFDGVPVTVTAIANPGYTFENWDTNIFITDPSAVTFTNNFTSNTTFTANFSGAEATNALVISEINFNSDSTLNSGDWIELHNTLDVAIDLNNYVLNNKQFYNNFTFPANSIIEANGYLVVAEDLAAFNSVHPFVANVIGSMGYSLHNYGDSITLKDAGNHSIISFAFNDNFPWPTTADGYGRTMELAFDLANPSLPGSWFAGCIGGSPGTSFSLCAENPVVTEINYNSSLAHDAGDWFELFNWAGVSKDLSGWQIRDENNNLYVIPAGTILSSGGGYLVFYQDATKFAAQFPGVTNKVGPLNFGLNSGGGIILLYDNTGEIFQSVSYEDEAPYPLSADGGGTALQIVNASLNLNDPSNWTESCPNGSPGSEFVTPCSESISSLTAAAVMELYPNPATMEITINLPEYNGEGNLNIYDITGKLIQQIVIRSTTGTTINISDYNAGIYLVKAIFETNQYSGTFIKN